MKGDEQVVSICVICEEPVLSSDRKYSIAIDKPIRVNLIVHRSCYQYCTEEELEEIINASMKKKGNQHGKAQPK